MRHSESLWKLLLCTVASAFLLPNTGSAQFRPKDTEWPSYAADLAGSRYRPLDQINASNFNDLEIAWRIRRTISATGRSTNSKARRSWSTAFCTRRPDHVAR